MLSKTIFAVAALSTLICAPAHAAKSTRSHTQKTLPPSKVPIASSIPASHLLGPSSVTWDAAQQGQFVISMTADKYGGLWAGSEDQGIWHLDPFGKTSNHWTQFTEKDGLGDNDNYALACDAKGRIWAGTLNHGVSVFNGKSWKNYDLADGPLGSHVFAIAVCPTDGDVWMATDAGLARYSLSKDTWSYYTRAEGLPSDQASALAFDKAGNIYVATQCDGLAIGSAVGGYHRWRQVRGSQGVPNAPSGSALPSDLTNAVLVARNGDIYVGTDCGLAWSWDGGASWHFVRGIDWQDKINGLAVPVQPVQAKVTGDVLLEDYVTALAQDASGRIYVGHRTKGVEVLDPYTLHRIYPSGSDSVSSNYVFRLLPAQDNQILNATYGDGLSTAHVEDKENALSISSVAHSSIDIKDAPFPTPAKPPSTASLQALRWQVSSFKSDLPDEEAVYLGDDWRTEGDGIGHYGRVYARMCAMDHIFSCTDAYHTDGMIGPHHSNGDGMREWITWMQTDNPRSLYTPESGMRRQAEWDDHGEGYPMTYEGPDIWIKVVLKAGDLHRLSLYFMNKDGHDGYNRYRDYLIEVRPYISDLAAAQREPALARSRVVNFWGGVYKQFVISTPGTYWVKVAKNNSINTIISGVMIDKLVGDKPLTDTEPMAWMSHVPYDAPVPQEVAASPGQQPYSASPQLTAARSLWSALDDKYQTTQGLPLQWPYRVFAYRVAILAGSEDVLLANWRWKMCVWSESDRRRFTDVMAASWQAGEHDRAWLAAWKDRMNISQ